MSEPLKVALISFEAVPFAKVGGLADVAGALPDALASCDVECRLIMPRFGQIDPEEHGLVPVEIPEDWFVGIDFEHHPLRVWEGTLPGGATVWFVGDDNFYGRDGIYNDADGHPFGDELKRYVFFAKGAVEVLKCLDWRDCATADLDRQLSTLETELRDTPFTLNRPPLMRIRLVRTDEDRYELVWAIHHMLVDGWSASKLLTESGGARRDS